MTVFDRLREVTQQLRQWSQQVLQRDEKIEQLEQVLDRRDTRIKELEERLREKEQQISEKEQQIDSLKRELSKWNRGHRARSGGKLAQKKPKGKGENPGRSKGHPGSGRNAPEKVDEWVPVPAPDSCPFCRGQVLADEQTPAEQKVEELVPAHTKIVCYRRAYGRCTQCRKAVLAPLPDGLGNNPKLGVLAQAQIVAQKTELGLTVGQTKRLMERQGLRLSRGAIQQVLHRAAKVTVPLKEQIHQALVANEVLWADETGHKLSGASGWLWLMMSREAVLFHWDRSRGAPVAQRLFRGFTGTIHSDYYAVYWTLQDVSHAPCWGKVVRRARELNERLPSDRTAWFQAEVGRLYVRGVQAQKQAESGEGAAERLREELVELAQDEWLGQAPELLKLQKRLEKHQDELVHYVSNPELEATNNRAERELREHAMGRHRSGGARSEQGACTQATNMTVVRTCQLQGLDYAEILRDCRIAANAQEHGDRDASFPNVLPRSPTPTKPDPPVPRLN